MRSTVAKIGLTAAVAGGLLTGLTAGPAAAGECATPFCGGTVYNENQNASYRDVVVTNCWQDGPTRVDGALPPCATNGWSSARYRAAWWLVRGQNSSAYKHYYDVDAFRVDAGCVLSGSLGGSTQSFGPYSTDKWIKISGTSVLKVYTHRC
ncbi:hypothetical protein [Nonomuraea sp. GTA35]|uniref:hypothetical protein n=1 Tax=Nonomuraea sp. GTA35 TaxID=1676746 RepID=UPI0035C06D27